ncbi:unnamed protein product [Paramecium sonneborni]|uniref:Transmembrane protein n=1 Tax=Paramecium sonneborni TaxID=65129 RepID=A0A8S1LGQ1_9CILI|nr:unnamed protein product [Paramecium sonneborni]
MFLLLLILQLASSYFINKDELKIIDHHLQQTTDHDLLNATYKEYLVGQIDAADQIIAISSLSSTFNQTIQVAILALNKQQTYTVYSLFYDKLQLQHFTINSQTPKFISTCTAIAFDLQQYVLACGQNYYFQNGTLIQLNYIEMQNTIQFQSHQNGFIVITKTSIFYFDFNFKLERKQQHTAQAFLITHQYLYIAQQQIIIIQNINEQDDFENISFECNQSIKAFAVFQDHLYVQCEKFQDIHYSGKIIEYPEIQTVSLSQTRKFLIIDSRIAQNIKYNTQIYSSKYKIYPLNFEDHLITFKDKNVYIVQLLDLSQISAKNAQDNFQIGELQFLVVDYGLKALKVNQSTNNQLQQPQTQTYYYSDYIIGNDLIVGGDGVDSGFLVKNLDNQLLSTDNLLSVIKYELEKIAFFFLEDQIIYADICLFNQINIDYKCIDSYIFTRIQSQLTDFQAIYSQITDQLVIAYTTEDSKGLQIFINDILYKEEENSVKYFLGQEFLVLIKKQSKQWIEIFRLQFQIYDLEAKLYINENIIQIVFGSGEIYILDNNNQIRAISDSIFGWQQVFIQKFNQTILSINYSEDQLLITSEKEIFIYSQYQLRGIVQYNLFQPKAFYTTDKYFYIQNSTHLIQLILTQKQALSNSLFRVIQQPFNYSLFLISYSQFELLFMNNKVLGLYNEKKFSISSQCERTEYFNLLKKKLKFSNSFNESLEIDISIVGTQLALRVIPYSLETLLKPLNRININDIFDGPISNIYIKESDKAQLKQMISQSKMMATYLTENKITDLIYFQNDKTLLFHSQLLQLCVINQECQTLQIIEDQMCKYLDQAQEYAFVICQNYLLYFNKTSPQNINKLTTNFSKIQKLSVDKNYISIYGLCDLKKYIAIYENFNLIYYNLTNELQDILIVNNTLFQLSLIELTIIDAKLKIVSINLLEELSTFNYSKFFVDTQFRQIKYLSNNNYLITTNNGPTIQIEITQDYKIQFLKRYTSIPGYIPIELTQITNEVFSVVFFDYQQVVAVFYQIQSQELIPYFQSIELGRIIASSYIRKSLENRFVIRDISNNSKLIEYDVNNNAQVLSNQKTEESLFLTFVAENFHFQTMNESLRLQIKIISEQEFDHQEQINLIEIFLYSFFGLILLLIILLIARQIRRYLLLKSFNDREKKKFDEEKLEYN